MKFAHIRTSEYFTFAKQIFHSEAISLARRANFVEKSTCEKRKCFFLDVMVLKNDALFVIFTNRNLSNFSACQYPPDKIQDTHILGKLQHEPSPDYP